jgi:hypothetical protein
VCIVTRNSSHNSSWRFCSALSQPSKPPISATTLGAQSLAALPLKKMQFKKANSWEMLMLRLALEGFYNSLMEKGAAIALRLVGRCEGVSFTSI